MMKQKLNVMKQTLLNIHVEKSFKGQIAKYEHQRDIGAE